MSFEMLAQASKDIAFLAEAKTSEQVADVLQRVVTLHNKRMSILHWMEVWRGAASTDYAKGTPHLLDERHVCPQSASDMHRYLQMQAYTLSYWPFSRGGNQSQGALQEVRATALGNLGHDLQWLKAHLQSLSICLCRHPRRMLPRHE